MAARARVSKGLPYLYFRTKEELFKAGCAASSPRISTSSASRWRQTDLPVEAFLKGPFLAFVQELVSSKRAFIARLLIAEGHKHPELTAFYYEQVVSRGIATMERLIERGIERGEFKPTPLRDYPQLLFAPVLTAIIWRGLFERYRHLDTDGLLRTNIELLTDAIRAPGVTPQSGVGVACYETQSLASPCRARRDRDRGRPVAPTLPANRSSFSRLYGS